MSRSRSGGRAKPYGAPPRRFHDTQPASQSKVIGCEMKSVTVSRHRDGSHSVPARRSDASRVDQLSPGRRQARTVVRGGPVGTLDVLVGVEDRLRPELAAEDQYMTETQSSRCRPDHG